MLCTKALQEFPEFMAFDDPVWPINGFIHVILKHSSDTHRKLLKKAAAAGAQAAEVEAIADTVEDLTAEISMVNISNSKFTHRGQAVC